MAVCRKAHILFVIPLVLIAFGCHPRKNEERAYQLILKASDLYEQANRALEQDEAFKSEGYYRLAVDLFEEACRIDSEVMQDLHYMEMADAYMKLGKMKEAKRCLDLSERTAKQKGQHAVKADFALNY